MASRIKEVELKVWEEIVGDCIRFEVKKDQVAVVFRCSPYYKVVFPCESKEGAILRELGIKLVGQKIGLIRTDIPAKPISVRTVTQEAEKFEG
jgi:hypothetical protein